MISKDKQYRTRDGREVRIYATDGPFEEPIHGAIKDYFGKWQHSAWFENGKNIYHNERGGPRFDGADLIEIIPRIKREYWVNLYNHEKTVVGGALFYSKKMADEYVVWPDRIACVKVVIDCEEGEGL